MNTGQQAVEISAKLYQCRDQQIFLGGADKFKATVQKWRPLFDSAMKEHNCGPIKALTVLLDRLEKSAHNDGMAMHLLCAVACELAEPGVTVGKEGAA
uniref:hypothetical protein n=1 Tax=Marinobacterium profundum TaxID=1714300 RepID=UPI00083689D7|nr:hypothetical protein [Marinobacterium profundum]